MTKKAYNYEFKMYLEGVAIPFKSAMIICTPNGVEADININPNKLVYDIKPKTAVQIFYRDWTPIKGKIGWHLMFDGFTSRFQRMDSATEGPTIAIGCRDFRMDIRKAPAAFALQGEFSIDTPIYYNQGGVFSTRTQVGADGKNFNMPINTFDSSGINDVANMVNRIAGSAVGRAGEVGVVKDGNAATTKKGQVKGSTFLDSVVRGMWIESVTGTSASSFLNKRIRADKRFMIPKNEAGYNFWSRQNTDISGSQVVMADSMFSSLEAAIMRLAGLFSVRVHSCSTPSLISIKDTTSSKWVIADEVKNYVLNRAEFGAPYILNETMLLPPLEFTSPPNSNIILPPMYDSLQWMHDIDSDITRGHFKRIDTLSTDQATDLLGATVQVPNNLFHMRKTFKDSVSKGRTPKMNRPPLTLEERYKGVSAYHGSVEMSLALKDISTSRSMFNKEDAQRIKDYEEGLKRSISDLKASKALNKKLTKEEAKSLDAAVNEAKKNFEKFNKQKDFSAIEDALNRHAILKYLNLRFYGRGAEVQMAFNPYIMAGFPGLIVSNDSSGGAAASKSIIGMVQQVKHVIVMSVNTGNAVTTVALNNARFIDEPTDMDKDGIPVYCKATNPEAAEIDPNTLLYKQNYRVGIGASTNKVTELNDSKYDLDDVGSDPEYKYAKDVISLSSVDVARSNVNKIYLDQDYEPNRIAKFYKEAFSHISDHFMIGRFGSNRKFMYDSMHEAVLNLGKNNPALLSDYEECIKFIARDVCSADAFFQGILGLSVQKPKLDENGDIIKENGKDVYEYVVAQDNFEDDKIYPKYYGATTKLWESGDINLLKKSGSITGRMTAPGQFSSILETMPVTAFIQERRDAVEAYLKIVEKRVQGVKYE